MSVEQETQAIANEMLTIRHDRAIEWDRIYMLGYCDGAGEERGYPALTMNPHLRSDEIVEDGAVVPVWSPFHDGL